jgi:hypothetical protein
VTISNPTRFINLTLYSVSSELNVIHVWYEIRDNILTNGTGAHLENVNILSYTREIPCLLWNLKAYFNAQQEFVTGQP